MEESKTERTKRLTIELYDQLPQELEPRLLRHDIRDQVFELNYTFFGYVASKTFINNSSITYEDKFQSACCAFMQEWWKFKYAAKYRTDLSFAVFFKPRLGEIMERELNEVKYSIRRSLCMEVGAMIDKHWGQVRYDDLSDPRVNISAEKMDSLKAMFGTLYSADLEDHEMYVAAESVDLWDAPSDTYNSIHDYLLHEMIVEECKLTDAKLLEMSDMLGLDFWMLKKALPDAEADLYQKLKHSQELKDTF